MNECGRDRNHQDKDCITYTCYMRATLTGNQHHVHNTKDTNAWI